ncbi:MAG: lysine--tRNA ligase [Deltaproteobacteria bacterium]|jgi:lysyl-tRNA synthetase class 1|nr:lysine--tRNA ligase [Deltaproteobacteria bacterium]
MAKNKKYKSWPFREAQKLKGMHGPFEQDETILFETGFGPSGLPHIGTFAEVARTNWVRNAFEHFTGNPTELIAFSDDMDGLRKVPLNLPNKEMLRENLGKPLSSIPDPFEEKGSFSEYMNNKLKEFLDAFGFDYTFRSSSEAYKRGDFDEGLQLILEKHDEITELITATLREENRRDWSPFMPICPKCGKVYTTRVTDLFPEEGKIGMACDRSFGEIEGCNHRAKIVVTGGTVKTGWKVDWALRWFSYGIKYEMYGKDLIESARLSTKICKILGKRPPAGLFYEMFLDENGEKISKSVGKGLTVDSWMKYAPVESLLFYIFKNPRKAKRLYFEMIPQVVDNYLDKLSTYDQLSDSKKYDSEIYHIFAGNPPAYNSSISFATVNNLVSAVGADDPDLFFNYLKKYDDNAQENEEMIRDLINKNLAYYRDFILPAKTWDDISEEMRPLFQELLDKLNEVEPDVPVEDIQSFPFDIAKGRSLKPAKFFKSIYRVLLGQDRGPRFGSFVRLVGVEQLKSMIKKKL